MNSTLRKVLTAACLLVGVSASAQFTGECSMYTWDDWDNGATAVFSLAEVADQVGTDAATLAAAFDSWTAENSTDADMFFLDVNGELSADYTQGSKGGFWVTVDGQPQAWGVDNTLYRWYNTISWDADEGTFGIYFGQYPGNCQVGDVFTPKFVLQYGGKEATFTVTVNITERPTYEVPEPATLLWQKLNVVKELTVDVNQKARSGYDADKVEVDLQEAAALMGITDLNLIAFELKKMLYATQNLTTDDIALGSFKNDTLTNEATAGGIGFWTQAYDNQDQNGTALECCSAGYGSSCHFYIESFEFDAGSGILSCNLGQYPNNLKGGKQYFTYIYLIYGDKAVSIRYNLNVEEWKLGNLADYEKAGESTVDVEMEVMTNYSTKAFNVDIETINAALGVEVDDFYALQDEVTFAGKNQEGVGYWFGADGYVLNWGDNAMCYITPLADDFSQLGLGQYPGHLEAGNELTLPLYFLGNGLYYQLNVHLKVKEPVVITGEFQSVAERSFIIQHEPQAEYSWSNGVPIPYDFITANIGDDYVVYGMVPLNEDGTEKTGNDKYSKQYTITEAPGFWLDKDGRVVTWGNGQRFGISAGGHASGKFDMIQEPNTCNVGDVLKTQLFFVNEETSEMVTFNFTYLIVGEVVDYETVGYGNLTAPVVGNDEASVNIDLSEAAEKLGVTVDDLLSEKNEWLHGMTEGGTFGAGFISEDGLGFNANGFYDGVNPQVLFYIVKEGDNVVLSTYGTEDIPADYSMLAQFCYRVGEKQYVFDIKFVSQDTFNDGIVDLQPSAVNRHQTFFDLSGRQVAQPGQHGIYIQNGRKVVK